MKKIILFILIILPYFIPTSVNALEKEEITTIQYIEDGIYLETKIEVLDGQLFSTNTKKATKTNTYKSAEGEILYTLSVTGTFTYTGTSSTCTNALVNAFSSQSDWKVISKSASKSDNKATAKATVRQYYDGSVIQTKYPTVTLSCSATGVLS